LTPSLVDEQTIIERGRNLVRIYLRTLSFPDTVLQMNAILCEQYKLGFYSGDIEKKLKLKIRP
jgi:hypothetical protein